ncbi:hypothetical protein LY90DRAFT_703128 [Neocallimastix californiae]|uniref:SGNH hydrolase-type esterase domain-containing protein n=1 Tax=Neocallimastix californiae TaxID=1754190 RepID=A0A1Y2CP15_9FUNG|nr:hypothetical protein LY90DRAFT_703128 [Neocallimastix californiae]|eukprot:ORY48789.1 hypothetical protein LY90DRAFT_703128 [Neocallimastix californiae]
MENLVVFGDSFSSTGTNFDTMKYSGNNISGGKNWPLQLLDLHNMTLWNFSVGGAVVNHMIVPRNGYKSSFITEYNKFSTINLVC